MTTEFGKQVLKYCIDKNKTLKEIAEAIGVSQAEVSFIVKGRRHSAEIEEKIKGYLESLTDNCKMSDFEREVRYKLIDKDVKLSQLAKMLGISRAAIYYAVGGTVGYDNIRQRMISYVDKL